MVDDAKLLAQIIGNRNERAALMARLARVEKAIRDHERRVRDGQYETRLVDKSLWKVLDE